MVIVTSSGYKTLVHIEKIRVSCLKVDIGPPKSYFYDIYMSKSDLNCAFYGRMSSIYVFYVCIPCMHSMYLFYVCILVFYVCILCLYSMYAYYICEKTGWETKNPTFCV